MNEIVIKRIVAHEYIGIRDNILQIDRFMVFARVYRFFQNSHDDTPYQICVVADYSGISNAKLHPITA
jgi:hypothetical protein